MMFLLLSITVDGPRIFVGARFLISAPSGSGGFLPVRLRGPGCANIGHSG